MKTLTTSSRLPAPAEDVWRRVTTAEGINDELMPIMRMTVPPPLRGVDISRIAPGTHLGRSYFLLLGFLPFDYDDITIAEVDQGSRFLEQSTMLSMRSWSHERTVTALAEGCEVTDRVSFQTRRPAAWIPGWEAVIAAVLGRVFRHRHQRLAAAFPAQTPVQTPAQAPAPTAPNGTPA
jgi:ligand-binding SRPBCC domain-containing protein